MSKPKKDPDFWVEVSVAVLLAVMIILVIWRFSKGDTGPPWMPFI